MDPKVIVLWIVLSYNIVCLNAETRVTHNYFSIITDQRQTDKKTHSYVKWQKSFIGRALLHIPLALFDNICSVEWQIKSMICRKALRFDENGFYLGSTVPLTAGCTNMAYSVRFSTLAKAETVPLSTITCPMITYLDLETDQRLDLPYIYKMSNAGKSSSAVIYVQTDKESNEIYPLYFIKNIAFKKLKSHKHFERSKSLDPLAETELSNKDDIISAYVNGRQADLAYVKFARFYLSMNLCGRPRPQKIYLCRRCIKKQFHRVGMEFDLVGYNDDKCKQYDAILSEKNEYKDEKSKPKNKLRMFRCPPIRIEYRSTRNFFHIYYVSSNLEHHSLTLFMRENQKGQLPRLEANIYELQMEPIVEDIRRQRFLPGPPKIITQNMRTRKSFREVEDEINSLEGEIAMPSTLIESDLPTSYLKAKISETVLHGRYTEKWLSDHVTMSFSKVKSIKLIYQRFMRAYTSIDVCSLSVKQITFLCNEAFKKDQTSQEEKKENQEELPFNEDSQPMCTKNKVKLSAIDADELETNLFSMSECHGNIQITQNMYFVGKNHLKNAATIYARIRIRAEDYLYPHILIAGINKYGLVKDEIEKKIERRTGDEIISEIE